VERPAFHPEQQREADRDEGADDQGGPQDAGDAALDEVEPLAAQAHELVQLRGLRAHELLLGGRGDRGVGDRLRHLVEDRADLGVARPAVRHGRPFDVDDPGRVPANQVLQLGLRLPGQADAVPADAAQGAGFLADHLLGLGEGLPGDDDHERQPARRR
jgi:hypothetical protein